MSGSWQRDRAEAALIADLWRYRRWIWDSAVGDFRHRYAGSGLGVFWNVVNPILTVAMYAFIFTRILVPRFGNETANSSRLFPLYLIAGLLPWLTFSDGIVRSTHTFLTNAVHLKKVAIPEVVFVAQTSVSTTLSMVIAVALLPPLALLLGQSFTWSWLLLPVILVIWQAFGFGLGLALSAVNVFFRDVGQILGVLLQIWMWSVPIVYFEDILPSAYRQLLPFNPAYPFVSALRGAVLDAPPLVWVWASMLSWTIIAIALGSVVAFRLRSEIRDAL